MKKMMLNEELLEKVNGGSYIENPIDWDPVLPGQPERIPDEFSNREEIEKMMREFYKDVKPEATWAKEV